MSTDLLSQIRSKRQTIADKRTGSKNTYKFKQRSTLIRILPSWSNEPGAPFYHDFGQAYIKDMDGNLLAVIGDRRMTYGEDDAVRNLISLALSEAPTDAQREHYKNMLAKQKHLVNAVVLNDKDTDPNTAEIVEFSQNQLDTIFSQMEKIVLDGENPLDLENGYDLEVEKEGTGLMTRYKFNFARRPSKVDSKVMETVTDLDAFVRSKFQDTDRAINAIKSIAQGATLAIPDSRTDRKASDYTTGSSTVGIEEAEYNTIDDAEMVREPVKTNNVTVSDDEIDALLKGI